MFITITSFGAQFEIGTMNFSPFINPRYMNWERREQENNGVLLKDTV